MGRTRSTYPGIYSNAARLLTRSSHTTSISRKTIITGSAALVVADLIIPTAAIAISLPLTPDQTGSAIRSGRTDQSGAVRSAIDGRSAKNVLLLIGDGMGDSEITIARDDQYGAGGRYTVTVTGIHSGGCATETFTVR